MFKTTSHRLCASHSRCQPYLRCQVLDRQRRTRQQCPKEIGCDSFVSLASGAKVLKTLFLATATFVISQIRQQIAHAALFEIVPNLLYTDSRNIYIDPCLLDSDYQHDSYCLSNSVCVEYSAGYCNTNPCGSE